MAPVATGSVPPVDRISSPSSKQSIEEVCFSAALICLEGHYTDKLAPMPGPLTQAKVTSMVTRTLEKTHTLKEVREALSKNVEIWIYLTKIFANAVPCLTERSVGPIQTINDPEGVVTAQESTALILQNYAILKEDLQMLNRLMHIARNLLVTADPQVPQDICAAVSFDQMVYQTIILCVNVTSKGCDGEILEETSRSRLNEVNELFKKLLVTSLQQAHNWTAKNDRNKMSFWSDALFDEEAALDVAETLGEVSGFHIDHARTEIRNWLTRNSGVCDKAKQLLKDYVDTHSCKAPGIPPAACALDGNWIPGSALMADDAEDLKCTKQHWNPEERDKWRQDKDYGRVSHEVDAWWGREKDKNLDKWTTPMPSWEFAKSRQESSLGNLEHRYASSYRADDGEQVDEGNDQGRTRETFREDDDNQSRNLVHEYVDDMIDEDDIDDNDSYGDGPMMGLLTEIPNILDPKQIEALHMIIKSCIFDAGSPPTRFGENLQSTRCRMLLALECGKSLLREILVFIAVWEKDEQSLIFELTTQIVEALHQNALIPCAWESLRIPKDVISPAQAVLLRLINHMFRKRYLSGSTPAAVDRDGLDLKLAFYIFTCIRGRIVPECLAFMTLQSDVRREIADPADFPVDNWDMERARDGLAQVLDFMTTVSEIDDMRAKLVEWEATFELIALLRGLDEGVPKKPLTELSKFSGSRPGEPAASGLFLDPPYGEPGQPPPPPPPPPPPAQEPAHTFPWAGIKIQILAILANLLQPARGKTSPGNPAVQNQIMREGGLKVLLSCCAYDEHNRFSRERVQICLKYLTDGSEEAQAALRGLVPKETTPARPPPPPAATGSQPVVGSTGPKVGGNEGKEKVQSRSPAPPAPRAAVTTSASGAHASGAHARLAGPSRTFKNAAAQQRMGERIQERLNSIMDDMIGLSHDAAAALTETGGGTSDEDFLRYVSGPEFRDHFMASQFKDSLISKLVDGGINPDLFNEDYTKFERALTDLKDKFDLPDEKFRLPDFSNLPRRGGR